MGLFSKCPNKGSILATARRTDQSLKKKTVGKPLAGIHIAITPTGKSGDTGSSGTKEFSNLVPGDYTVSASITKEKVKQQFELAEPTSCTVTVEAKKTANAVFAVHRLAQLKVHVHLDQTHLDQAKVSLTGPKAVEKTTNSQGVADFGAIPIGTYQATVSFVADDINDRRYLPPSTATTITLERDADLTEELVVQHKPSLSVTVKSAAPAKALAGIKVKVTGMGKTQTQATVGSGGLALFGALTPGAYTIEVALDAEQLKLYKPCAVVNQTMVVGTNASVALELASQPLKVYLKLAYQDPEETVRLFPKDFALKAVFDDKSTKDLTVQDDKGTVYFEADRARTTVTLCFDSTKVRYLMHTKPQTGAETVAVLEDQTDDQLLQATLAGKRFFALPKTWSLVHAAWKTKDVTVPQNGVIALPEAGIGTDSAPAELTLQPVLQYVRFEFYDRKYLKTHTNKRVGVPPVVLKGARQADAAGTPQTPVAGTHDAVSNWQADPSDNDKARQVLPWVISKKDDGAALADLDNKMLLEFGWKDGFVHSTSATARAIETLPADDAKRKISKTRNEYVDLPKSWKSCCYYTRFGDTTKNKFFDELQPADIKISLTKTTPMIFSLDDVVLVTNAMSQAVQDANKDGTATALCKHSRVCQLTLDPEAKFQVKVHDPETDTAYHSKSRFQKESAAEKYRNVIGDPAPLLRAVVFCTGVYDVFDKRTETADFSKKEILGARAAKLGDTDVTLKKRFDQNSDVTSGYMHKTRVFDAYFLHYGGTDGTTVYSALVSYWSAYVFSQTAKKPGTWTDTDPLTNDIADARNFRTTALNLAMTRWNEKDYQLEESDGKTDIIIKTFCLFEAKEVEDPVGTFNAVGGKPHCQMAVGTSGSWATDTTMYMRKAAYQDEADWSGDVRTTDYDGVTRKRLVIAHELGHAVIGLWDDYITQTLWGVPTYKTAQRYPGVPYNRDDCSIMSVNRAPRLRMYWGRANWINDEAKAGKTLHTFLAAKQFALTYSPAGKTKHKFVLPEAARDIYKAKYSEANAALGNKGKADLLLYQLGDDEFARLTKGGTYKGLLVVEVRLKATYKKGLKPKVDAWVTGTAYTKSKCAEQGGLFYLCVADHTAGTFATDLTAAKWVKLDPEGAVAAWATGTAYTVGKWITNAGKHYVCAQAHTAAAAINTDITAGKLVESPCQPDDWPNEAAKKDWVVDVHKKFIAALEGPEGKFYLKSTDNADFDKVYVRPFIQWWDGVGTDPANTQFTLEIIKGGTASYCYPTGATIKVADNTDATTIVRYLMGKIDDAQPVSGQTPTAALTKADLAKLKDWAHDKATGTFTVEDIP